jgi:thymidylate synthase
MHELLAHWLGVDVGEYHHFADSLHIYQEHMQAARSVPQTPLKSPSMDPLVIAWEAFDQILSSIITGTLPASASPEWISLADVMASYRTWVEGDRHAAIVAASDTVGALGRALERWYTHLQSADTSHRS